MEKIASSEIETIGLMEYIKFRGSTLRIIRPENYLPVSTRNNERSRFYVIIPRDARYGTGILAEEIIDTVYANMEISNDDMKTGGLMRTAILQNRIVLAIDAYKLLEKADHDHTTYRSYSSTCTVLLVEDMPSAAKIEKNALENAGYRVLTAENGEDALEILQNNEVELVVSDIQMPLMDGLELVKHIRSDNG